jgi:hypothetical protein
VLKYSAASSISAPAITRLARAASWQRMQAPADAGGPCLAAHAIRDGYPAGVVELSGSFAMEHLDHVRAVASHREEAQRAEQAAGREGAISGGLWRAGAGRLSSPA